MDRWEVRALLVQPAGTRGNNEGDLPSYWVTTDGGAECVVQPAIKRAFPSGRTIRITGPWEWLVEPLEPTGPGQEQAIAAQIWSPPIAGDFASPLQLARLRELPLVRVTGQRASQVTLETGQVNRILFDHLAAQPYVGQLELSAAGDVLTVTFHDESDELQGRKLRVIANHLGLRFDGSDELTRRILSDPLP